jgi:ribosomal protein S18 acetylase RimI-like enzyme
VPKGAEATMAPGSSGKQDRRVRLPRARQRGLTKRTMTNADLPFLSALYASTRADEIAPLPWNEAEKSAFLAQQFHAQHTHYLEHYPDAHWLVIEQAGEPVGRLYLEWWPSEIRIIDIALMPQSRGDGLGRALLEDVMVLAGKDGLAVGIHVEKTNPAMSLYLRLGFDVVEDKGVYDLLVWKPAVR